MSQFQEMIERDRDHASVLFWSLGNESQWGTNFAAERRFATEHDPSRPTSSSVIPTMRPWKPRPTIFIAAIMPM